MSANNRPLLAIALVALATLTFAAADVVTKILAAHYPVPVIAAMRYAVNLVLLLVFLGPKLGTRLWHVNRPVLATLRSLCLAAATLTMGMALRLMPLGETVAIIYLAPFIVMLLSMPLLGEKVPTAGWIATAIGFLGVLLIVRPGAGLAPLGVIWALTNAGFAALYHLSTRFLTRSESTFALLFNTAWVGLLVFGVLALPSLLSLQVTRHDLGLMGLLGVFATLGHYLFTSAYRHAPPALLAPVNYLHLVWAGGLGWLIFGHLPDGFSLIGMALVCLAGAGAAWVGWLRQRQNRADVSPQG